MRDIDIAVSSGPGLRWAVMGPTLLFHLGAGDGGLAAFCERYAERFNRWWDDLGEPRLDQATTERLVEGLSSGHPLPAVEQLAATRDELLTAVIGATHRARRDRSRHQSDAG